MSITVREFVFAIIAAIIVSSLWALILILRKKWEGRPLRKLLNFGDGELLFVYTCWTCRATEHTKPNAILPCVYAGTPSQYLTEHTAPNAILPYMAIEDVTAIHSVINALREINWKGKLDAKCAYKLTDDEKKRNIVTVCSSKINPFTKEVFDTLTAKGINIPIFVEGLNNPDEWQIKDGTACFTSPSYEQIRTYLKDGKVVAEQEINDVAMIAKVTNPLDEEKKNKILLLAGVRGIGTWGAAECVRRKWKRIYNKKGKGGSEGYRKDGNFVAVIDVKYRNFNILHTKVQTLQDLP